MRRFRETWFSHYRQWWYPIILHSFFAIPTLMSSWATRSIQSYHPSLWSVLSRSSSATFNCSIPLLSIFLSSLIMLNHLCNLVKYFCPLIELWLAHIRRTNVASRERKRVCVYIRVFCPYSHSTSFCEPNQYLSCLVVFVKYSLMPPILKYMYGKILEISIDAFYSERYVWKNP